MSPATNTGIKDHAFRLLRRRHEALYRIRCWRSPRRCGHSRDWLWSHFRLELFPS